MIKTYSGQGDCLCLSGEITINEASALKDALLSYLSSQVSLSIDLQGVTKIDTSGLQLLYAARQTAIGQGKHLSLKNPSPAILQAVKLAGLIFQSPDGYLESKGFFGREEG
ncbi:MAG: STAS domain-containing protein [bacterium]|nr:STAS domain-containing protein [bacterium]